MPALRRVAIAAALITALIGLSTPAAQAAKLPSINRPNATCIGCF